MTTPYSTSSETELITPAELTLSEENEIYSDFKKHKTEATYTLAHYLTKKYNIITVGEKEREFYVYQNGYYKPAENEIIFPEVQRILKEQTTKSAKMETLHKIADMTSHPRSIFSDAALNFIPLANGVYDTGQRLLLPHSPIYHFTYQFPIIYNQDAKAPLTEAFFKQILTEEQIPLVEEWIGYYFYRLYSFKKAIIFVGEGDTGKTTLLEVITHLLGRSNLSAVSLQKLTGDKFSAAHLYEKHGNLVDELSAKDIQDTGNFKMATGGGSITGEYKFGNQFSFINYSKFTFACNKIPDVKESDDTAYFNRWNVVRFEKTIEKKIPNFIATLTTDEERSGLFNLAILALERLLVNGQFSNRLDAMDTKREMMRSGSSIAQFVADCVSAEPGADITKADMYNLYTTFCASRKVATETMDMFGKRFLFQCPEASEGLIYDPEKPKAARVRGWRNIRVITPEIATVDEEFEAL
jgi:P4 family phage/plasmid primase-like protien